MPWICQNCETENLDAQSNCAVCSWVRTIDQVWICTVCETLNPSFHALCEVCGSDRGEAEIIGIDEIGEHTGEISELILPGIAPEWEVPGKVMVKVSSKIPVYAEKLTLKHRAIKFFSGLKPKTKFGLVVGGIVLTTLLAAWMGFLFYIPAIFLGYHLFKKVKVEKGKGFHVDDILPYRDKFIIAHKESVHWEEEYEYGHSQPVKSVAFAPDGKTLYSCDEENRICVWQTFSGEKEKSFVSTIRSEFLLRLSPNYITTAYSGSINLWNIRRDTKISFRTGDATAVKAVQVSRKGRIIAVSSAAQKVWIKDLIRQIEYTVSRATRGQIICLDISDNENYVAMGDTEGIVTLWDIVVRKAAFSFEVHAASILSICFSFSSKYLACGTEDGFIYVYSISNKDRVAELTLPPHPETKAPVNVHALVFAPDDSIILSGDDAGRVIMWDWESGEALKQFEGRFEDIRSMAIEPVGWWLAVGGAPNEMAIYKIR